MSATSDLILEVEREMQDLYAQILAETDETRLSKLTTRLDWKAHERLLAIRFEAARIARTPPPIGVLVTTSAQTRDSGKGEQTK